MKGLQRIARRAILARLKAHAELGALVPPASVHAQAPVGAPSWPFVKTGAPRTTPKRATGIDGAMIAIPVHAFARDRVANGAVVETAEDHAGRIGEQIEAALDAKGDDLPGVSLSYLLSDIMLMTDAGEAGAFHYVATVNVKATS